MTLSLEGVTFKTFVGHKFTIGGLILCPDIFIVVTIHCRDFSLLENPFS